MRHIVNELKKHVSFRETWVGYILGTFYLVSALAAYWNTVQYAPQRWHGMFQNIKLYGSNFSVFLVIIGIARIMCYERERNTDVLLFTSAYGKRKAFFSKIGFAAAYSAVVVAVLGTVSIICDGYTFGFKNALGYIDGASGCFYVEEGAATMPNLVFCIFQYFLLYLGVLYLTYFVMLLSQITKRPVLAMCISGVVYVVSVAYDILGVDKLSGIAEKIADILWQYGFAGFMMLESYSWGKWGPYYDEWISDLWKPILFVCCVIVFEICLMWVLWSRKDRK